MAVSASSKAKTSEGWEKERRREKEGQREIKDRWGERGGSKKEGETNGENKCEGE